MWPLLGFSIVAIALITKRCWFWFRVKHQQRRVVRKVLALYPQDPDVTIHKLRKAAHLPIARELEQPNSEEFRLALESESQAEIPTLKRFNTVFDTIGPCWDCQEPYQA